MAKGRPAAPQTRPVPLPKRPKGQWLVGSFLFIACASVIYLVWHTFARYEAVGTVEGRVIEVSSPCPGTIQSLLVREGDDVRQGQPLLAIHNLELQQQRERIRDELKVAQADLQAELAKLRIAGLNMDDQRQKARADYYTLLGQLEYEKSKLADSEASLERLRPLRANSAISEQVLQEQQFDEAGRRSRVENLKSAVEELKRRMETAQQLPAPDEVQLRPHLVRIENLEAELRRLSERIEEGGIRAPVAGKVIRIHRFVGEAVSQAQTVLELLVEGSLEVVLYVPQGRGNRFVPGQQLDVVIEPISDRVRCRVVRLGNLLESPPTSVKRHYRTDEKLIPIHAEPERTPQPMRLGNECCLPLRWWPSAPPAISTPQEVNR